MKKIVYYVATSIDGFIAGPEGDASAFMQGGNGVDQYLNDLKEFDTVIMGRKTYEFGYQYGLQPGKAPYEHMQNYIFSDRLSFEQADEQVIVRKLDLSIIKKLKSGEGTDIYLCGGGQFANWLLEHELIDILKIKLNPFIQVDGIKLFNGSSKVYRLKLMDRKLYEQDLQILTYEILYGN